jgi:hypothetical protein
MLAATGAATSAAAATSDHDRLDAGGMARPADRSGTSSVH